MSSYSRCGVSDEYYFMRAQNQLNFVWNKSQLYEWLNRTVSSFRSQGPIAMFNSHMTSRLSPTVYWGDWLTGWFASLTHAYVRRWTQNNVDLPVKADSHITCLAHAVPLPCRAAKGLSHLIYTVRPCLIHTCHAAPMPSPTMSFFSRPQHSKATERRIVG